MLLLETRLGSQSLVVIGDQIRFQALFNETARVSGTATCESYECQMGFQTLLQATSIVFFWLLNTFYLRTQTQSKQLNDQPIFGIHIRQFRLVIPPFISIKWFKFFQGGTTKEKRTYLISSLPLSTSKLFKSSSSSLSCISNRWHFEPLGSVLSLSLSSNCQCLSTASVFIHLISK